MTADLGVLCLGEALVDLIAERHTDRVAPSDPLVPHFGGAAANVAMLIAQAGVNCSLAGGVGNDPWGRWLRERLVAAGVGLDHFKLFDDQQTPLALVTVDSDGEPSYSIYGESLGTVDRIQTLRAAVDRCSALLLMSNTLVRADERAASMAARQRALALEKPVIFDPNLRMHRWKSPSAAVAAARACLDGAALVRCNAFEARLLTGNEDLGRAAGALREAGARSVVISMGRDGALFSGEVQLMLPGVSVPVVSTVGAGDGMTAALVASFAQEGMLERGFSRGLRSAIEAGAACCERWGAVD